MRDYSIVSLFSGCGGLDLGFHNMGGKIKYACDNDPAAINVFKHNISSSAFCVDVTSEEFNNDLRKIGSCDIVLGGFPCQGFSKSGPKKKDDPRNSLYLTMVDAVKVLKPKIFVAENVDGMAQNFKGEFLATIKENFGALGYNVDFRILNAADYGVPQFRRRVIFIGVNSDHLGEFNWPSITHNAGRRNGEFKSKHELNNQGTLFNQSFLKPPISIKEAIEDLLEKDERVPDHTFIRPKEEQEKIIRRIGKGQKLCNVRFSETSIYTWQIPEVFGEVSKREIKILETIARNRRKKKYGTIPNGNPLAIEIVSELAEEDFSKNEFLTLEKKGYLKRKGDKFDLKGAMFASGLYKRPNWNLPSPTIITFFDNPRFFVHPILNRPFTIRECARLQSFPDDFNFLAAGVSKKDAYRLIGNAVPPKLAQAIAKEVFQTIDQININESKAA